jgi:hypothetical protein
MDVKKTVLNKSHLSLNSKHKNQKRNSFGEQFQIALHLQKNLEVFQMSYILFNFRTFL